MLAALDLLATLPGRRVAVLGEMLELGDEASQAHRSVGAHAAAVSDRLLVVGDAATAIAEGALAAGMPPGSVAVATDRAAALERLQADLRPGDTLLVKASRAAQLDLLVEALMRAAGTGAVA
jgi:UDP-N-acetylmuramoyl-tripeptide--D-alanyl-D-alanine ligase